MLFSGIASNIDNNKIIAATTETTAKIYGDVTKDGKLDILDSISLTNYVLNSNKPISSNFDVSAADLDGDGVVNTIDVILMKHFITNSIDIFPVEANIDSDGDGLSDYIEKNITKTDPKLKDTDSDGLSDGEEIMVTNTDPLLKDTDLNGINDGDEDPDKDGLKNIDEIKYKTNPLVEDTDEDGLNDGDEINKHKTSPLVEDTDEDGLDDYEEIILGLNPLNKASKGVADNLYTLEQTVKADNEILKDINKAESPYSFSASGKVAGLMENRLLVEKSGYTNALQSDSIVGDILDISYDENVKMEKVKIDFSIKTATDINKYMIFRYYEDLNILLPEETFYNTTNKSIYIETDELGTFCVMDTEAWALSINSEMPLANKNNVENSEFINSKEIEVFFVVYTDSSNLTDLRTAISKASTILIENCNKTGKSIKIYYVGNSGVIATNLTTGTKYVDNNSTEEERLAMINRVGQISALQDKLGANYRLDNVLNREMKAIALSNTTSLKYCFIMDINFEPRIVVNQVTLVVDELKQNGMYFTFIYDRLNENQYDYKNFNDNENKYIWASGLNNVEITSNYISKTILPEQTFYEYKAGNLLGKIVLEAPIIQDYYKAYKGEIIDFTGFADSDKDGVYDFQEINFRSGLIKFDEAGNLILPKYNEICAIKTRAKLGYDVLLKKYNNNVTLYNAVKDLEVLLLTSHPNKVDSDGDEINDYFESDSKSSYSNPLSADSDKDGIGDFNDPQPLVFNKSKDIDWNVWASVDSSDYMERREINEIIFIGVQRVLKSKSYHSSVLIFASPASDHYLKEKFVKKASDYWSDGWNDVRYVTLGAGPGWFLSGDPLTAGYNRERDVMLDIKVQMINLTTAPMVNNQIDELIQHHQHFYSLLDDFRPSYDLYPENENEQNSNSYTAGLLIASNIDDLGKPEYNVPGYQYPLKKSYFGVDE